MTTELSDGSQRTALPSWRQKWWVAVRPFALPASTMPVIFGTVLAVTIGGAKFDPAAFLAALAGMAILHSGANLLNDVYDFKRGIDQRVNPVSGSVVRRWITPREALIAGWLCMALGAALGLYVYTKTGAPILWLGVIGIVIGVFYTWGPFPLKFNALGDLAVFLDFGILGAVGAWAVQTGSLSWVPVFWAAPMALLVIGILHANNWRDIHSDAAGQIRTVANLLGDRSSQLYYVTLLGGPFVYILGLLVITRLFNLGPQMPWTFLIVFLAAPLALRLIQKGQRRQNPAHPLDFLALDGATAQLNLQFGLLCTAALALHALIGWLV